jgi:hypothetical protein
MATRGSFPMSEKLEKTKKAMEMPQQISPGSRTCYTRIGGHTAFADTRTTFDELPSNLKEQLLKNDHIADHSTWYFLQLAVLDLLDFLAHINPPASPDGLTSPCAAPRSLGQDEPLYCGSRIAH